jgi:hypothetical protein
MTVELPTADAKEFKALIVDDHSIVLQGLSQFIAQEPDLEVCGSAQQRISLSPDLAPPAESGEPFKTIPKRLPPSLVPGGITLLAGVYTPPVQQLEGTVFSSFLVPGLALLVIVVGGALLALVLLVRRSRLAPVAAGLSGAFSSGLAGLRVTRRRREKSPRGIPQQWAGLTRFDVLFCGRIALHQPEDVARGIRQVGKPTDSRHSHLRNGNDTAKALPFRQRLIQIGNVDRADKRIHGLPRSG